MLLQHLRALRGSRAVNLLLTELEKHDGISILVRTRGLLLQTSIVLHHYLPQQWCHQLLVFAGNKPASGAR
jgi:hypothetical protein